MNDIFFLYSCSVLIWYKNLIFAFYVLKDATNLPKTLTWINFQKIKSYKIESIDPNIEYRDLY